MFEAKAIATDDKATLYAELAQQAQGLLAGEPDMIANAANFAALVFDAVPDINWAGFYLFDGKELVVGPFRCDGVDPAEERSSRRKNDLGVVGEGE